MTSLRVSDPVPLRGVEEVEREGSAKKVVAATVRLEERYGPAPNRRVVSIETRDGAVYRFQRYGTDEYLAFYRRENPDGEEFKRRAALPQHVRAVRRAIMDGDVLPEFEAMIAAERDVGTFDVDDDDQDDLDDHDGGGNDLLPVVGTEAYPPAEPPVRRTVSDSESAEYATDGGDGPVEGGGR